jgi:hypothetical protein
MPIKKYLLWVGAVLLCGMLLLDAFVPKAPPRVDYDFDRAGLKIKAPDSGIAPDTGAIAITANSVTNEPSDPPTELKITDQTAARQAFGKLESGAPKKPPHKRAARPQPARSAESAATAQNPWSSPWSSEWSSNRTSDWASNGSWRGATSDEPRQHGRRQAPTPPAGNQWNRNWNFNFAGGGRSNNCWGC